jgi:putative nucleotidyltransferase with HDIG domain
MVGSGTEELSFLDDWRTWSPSPINIIPFTSSILLGMLFAFLYRTNLLVTLLVLPPLVAIYYSFKKNAELQETTRQAVQALANTIDARDSYTFQHSERVANMAGLIAEKMDLSISEIETIVTAGRIHDLGKVGVSDQILRRPGKLSDVEWAMIKEHPARGAEILNNLRFFDEETSIVAAHHEHFNGSGYPDQLEGDDIPLGARILAVADAFDAMRSDRPYRKALSRAEAIAVLLEEKSSHFDPEVVEAFLEVLDEHPELDREELVTN